MKVLLDPALENQSSEEVFRFQLRCGVCGSRYTSKAMPFSKAGLLDQLTSEYGGQYPEDAAQYAVDNVVVDWNEEALEAALAYREMMGMSNAGLHDQLTSEYGDQFTDEEADYAIANLPD